MATIVLTAVGTLIGGPIGGSIGALIGGQIDSQLFRPGDREGPRLKELAVTTSSYGTPVPRHFGTMRAAGSIIWATDLVESREKTGGGKGRPATTTFSYSTSFAVALSSRPIASVGRIWADGNLLRGAAGDLKAGGTLRIYAGHGDQRPDPLIASAEGANCPAFRGIAYAVFEDLQLADFGNRLPALTFELIADAGDVDLIDIVAPSPQPISASRPLPALAGFSDEGGALGNILATIDLVYPLASDADATGLRMFAPDDPSSEIIQLPDAVIDPSEESFGGHFGSTSNRQTSSAHIPSGLRYYDIGRDYQAGMQLAGGRASGGQVRLIEFPGALAAADARELAERAAKRARYSQDKLNYRIAELDPGLSPGTLVAIAGRSGVWRIESWEWREFGLELALSRLPATATPSFTTDAGKVLRASDARITPTWLCAFELPWDGIGASDQRQIFAAASSRSAGWTGAIIYAEHNGALEAITGSGSQRSVSGTTLTALPSAMSLIGDRRTTVDVQLHAEDFVLDTVSMDALASGANRALIGEEIIQFAKAAPLGAGLWRLTGLLRGRGGTEHVASSEISAGQHFNLLNGTPVRLDEAIVGNAVNIAAIGLADDAPAIAPIAGLQSTLRPLSPVHPRARVLADGKMQFCWTRRARGAWRWDATVEPALVEQTELYEVGFGNPDQPRIFWQTAVPQITLTSGEMAQLVADFGAGNLWVRQIGTYARSLPLLLSSLD